MAKSKSRAHSQRGPSQAKKRKGHTDAGRRRWDLSGWSIIILLVIVAVFFYSFYRRSAVVSEQDLSPLPLRIQILNGCGEKGITELVEKRLGAGAEGVIYHVVDRDNAQSFGFPQTLVVDRSGNREAALKLAKLLGVEPRNIITQKLADNVQDLDFTIVVGADFQKTLGS
jgi:hypothetical protein